MPSLGLIPIGGDLGDPPDIAVLNTIVNKNVIVVQYTTRALQKPTGFQPADSVISSKTKISTDFGTTWRELILEAQDDTWEKYAINPTGFGDNNDHEMMGREGALISFIVRHSSGGKVWMYTPIVKVARTDTDEFFPNRCAQIQGWLVHNEKGQKINTADQMPVPQVRPAINGTHQQLMHLGLENHVNVATGAITLAGNPIADLPQPFTTFHLDPMIGGNINETNVGQEIANRTSTVDYTSGGKRYTIVQLYKNIVVKKGNVYSAQDAGGGPVYIGLDYYAFTLPFLFVFDHDNFRTNTHSLTWLDVFNLEGRLMSLNNSVRGNKRAKAYIKSLLTDDANFNNTTGNDKVHFKRPGRELPVDTSIHFTPTPRGELMKVYDSEDKKDLLGFVYGNHRYVCTSDPTEKANWVIGEVSLLHKYPRQTYAFAFDRFDDRKLLPMRDDAEVKYAEAHELYYREYSVPMTKNAPLRFDVASDRVFAVADNTKTVSTDLTYRFMVFAKDPASGRYTIDFHPESLDVGVVALTGAAYSGENNYPVEITSAKGILYTTKDFVTTRPIQAYVDPLDPGVEEAIEPSQLIEEKVIDLDDYNLVSTYCVYFDRWATYQHKTLGNIVDFPETLFDTSCGFDNTGPQPAKGATMLVYPDIELAVNQNVPGYRCVQVEMVFSGNGILTIRPKAERFDSRFIGAENGSVAIKLDNPQRYGLLNNQASFNLNITAESAMAIGSYSGNDYYASAKLNSYDELNIQNPFGGPTRFSVAGAGETLTLTVPGTGPIGTKIIINKNNSQPSKTLTMSGRTTTVTRTDLLEALFLVFSN